MCGKAANSYLSTIKFAPEWYKTQETYHKVASKGPFILKCCLGKYEAQKVW